MDIHAYSCPFFQSDDGQPNVSGCLFLLGSWLSIFYLLAHSGAAITVPFLTRSNVKFHPAIGTASAIGFPIALAGAAGYIVNGLHVSGLPAYSLGFIYLPALIGLTAAGIWPRPGARNWPIVCRSPNCGGFSH